MSKQSGLGDHLLVAGVDLSGDIGSLGAIGGGPAALDVTPINKSGMARIGGLRDGRFEYAAFWNPGPEADAAHDHLSLLPRTDVQMVYCRGLGLGRPACAIVAKQTNYDGTRSNDGAFTFSVSAPATGYGIEWGEQATPGVRADTAAANGDSIDLGAPSNLLAGTDGTFDVSVGTWIVEGNATLARVTSPTHAGAGALEITSVASGNASAASGQVPVKEGQVYPCSAWFRAATDPRTCELLVNWFDASHSYIDTGTVGDAVDSTSAWTQVSGSVTAPASAAYAGVVARANGTGDAGEVHYLDDVFLGEGSTAHGLQAYLQVLDFTGTSVTVKLQESSDDGGTDTWADVTGGGFAAATAPGVQRIATARDLNVERYLRVVTSGTFSVADFLVVVVRNPVETVF